MAKLLDPQIEAFAQVILRHLGLGEPCQQAPAICKTWLQDFRDSIGDQKMRPINTLYRAHPFKGKTPLEGHCSYPLFAIWRSRNAWKWFTNDTDEDSAAGMFLYVLPAELETDRAWPILTEFDRLLRRVLEHAPEELDDYALLVEEAQLSEWAVELKSELGFAGPGGKGAEGEGQLLFPTLTGAFTFKTTWERNEKNLGLQLERFHWALINYLLKGVGQDGDLTPYINPILRSLAQPTQP